MQGVPRPLQDEGFLINVPHKVTRDIPARKHSLSPVAGRKLCIANHPTLSVVPKPEAMISAYEGSQNGV